MRLRSTTSFLQRTLALCVLGLVLYVPSAQAQFGLALTYGFDTDIGGQISTYHSVNTDMLDGLDGLRVGCDISLYVPNRSGRP